ncbi:MAG: ferritin family protein [Hyphomicrobiaceae bacterium]|nr:ferritin family protein [Hyphomicrobiaceae bacterium]
MTAPVSGSPPGRSSAAIASVGELLAHALRMEEEAEERYRLLADQMETHNNPELAGLFRKLAGHEAHHAEEIRAQIGRMELPGLESWDHSWGGPESPEAVDFGAIRYTTTPRQALQLALDAERRAFEFFDRIAAAAGDPELKRWAAEFAAEEDEHVRLVLGELDKHPEPPRHPDDDPDPPVPQD